MKRTLVLLFLLASFEAFAADYKDSCGNVTQSNAAEGGPYGASLIKLARAMPPGGGYKASDDRIDVMAGAVSVKEGVIDVDPLKAGANFCSGATYMVLLKLISQQQKAGSLKLSSEAVNELRVLSKKDQPDGTGVWGRWNADGPGAAVLVKELGLGRNFSESARARAGDFMKIYWNDKIGRGERGHLVLFDSYRDCKVNGETVKHVCFWSSNTTNDVAAPGDQKAQDGWGMKCVPRSNVARATFSRITSLDGLNKAPEMMGVGKSRRVQKELASLGEHSMTPAEMAPLIYESAPVQSVGPATGNR